MKNRKIMWYLPIEPLEQRYTAQMKRWVSGVISQDPEISKHYFLRVIEPETEMGQNVSSASWLDQCGTIDYKAGQIRKMASLFSNKKINSGDVILLGDVWFPGIEALRYMADLSGIKIKIIGWHYAGTYDPNDTLAKNLTSWGKAFEDLLLNHVLDAICVGSNYHGSLLRYQANPRCEIIPYGLAWNSKEVQDTVKKVKKENIVVFPHRLAPEKQPKSFIRLANKFKNSDWKFVISTNSSGNHVRPGANITLVEHQTKDEYYQFLNTCKIFYSCALQETFGYALHEAIALGLSVVAPRRCSYTEMLDDDPRFLYGEDDPLGEKLLKKNMVRLPVPSEELTSRFNYSISTFIRRALCLQ